MWGPHGARVGCHTAAGPQPIRGGKGQFAAQFWGEPAPFSVQSCSVIFPFKFLVQNIENGNTVFNGHKYLENTSSFFFLFFLFFFSTLTHTKAKKSRTTRRQQGEKKKRYIYRLHFCTSRRKRKEIMIKETKTRGEKKHVSLPFPPPLPCFC